MSRAYRCDMCHRVLLLDDWEDPPMYVVNNFRSSHMYSSSDEPTRHYDICRDCSKKIESFISENAEEVRKKGLE